MIIIITGASHTGKTLLAQNLLERYKFPYLSIDHIKMGLIRSGNINLNAEDDEQLTPYLWGIVREIIKTAIENKQNLIVEGCYVPFDWERDFDSKYLENIKYYCLIMSKEYIEKPLSGLAFAVHRVYPIPSFPCRIQPCSVHIPFLPVFLLRPYAPENQ